MDTNPGGGAASSPVGPSRRHGAARLIWMALIVGFALLGAVGVARAARLGQHVWSLASQGLELAQWAQEPRAALRSPVARAALRSSLQIVRQDLSALQRDGSPLWWGLRRMGWVPVIGGDLQYAPTFLPVGMHLVDAGLAGLAGLEPVLAAHDPESNIPAESLTAETLWRLKVSRAQFAEAELAVAKARADLDTVPAQRLSPRAAALVALAQAYVPALQAALGLLQDAPALLGADQPATYLILAQNDQELRPTGGFVSGVGMLRIEGAKIVTATLEDAYAVDGACECGIHAPAPLREYMWAPALKLRDANWSPDLPSSAAVARSIYSRCRGVQVDGVIAFDLEAAGAMLDVLGPLQPPGYDVPVTRESFQEFLARYWANPMASPTMSENRDAWWLHRKDFMGDLLREMVNKIDAGWEQIPARRAVEILVPLLHEKHLQVYVDAPSAQRALESAGWAGAMRQGGDDYLLIVDANVGYRKVNPYIEQHIDYRVAPGADGMTQATLTLDYRNNSPGSAECIAGARYDATYGEMMQGCYWDYVRVYIPRGSRLLSAAGGDSAASLAEERGRAVLGMLLIVPPGQSRQIVFTYETPASPTRAGGYELLVQKQAGTRGATLRVAVSGAGPVLRCEGCPSATDLKGSALALTLNTDMRITWQGPAPARARKRPLYGLIVSGLLCLGGSVYLARSPRRRGSASRAVPRLFHRRMPDHPRPGVQSSDDGGV